MNTYEILALSYGNTKTYRVNGNDIVSAIYSTGEQMQHVISVRLIGTQDIEDLTQTQ